MELVIALLQGLFALHNGLDRLTGLERRLPQRPPRVSPGEAAGGGEWGYLVSRGRRLFYRRWVPAGEPRAALLAVHGAGAHGGHFPVIGEYLAPRYRETARRLADSNRRAGGATRLVSLIERLGPQ
jgi:hypothetical protein